jgi:hypothetical protein
LLLPVPLADELSLDFSYRLLHARLTEGFEIALRVVLHSSLTDAEREGLEVAAHLPLSPLSACRWREPDTSVALPCKSHCLGRG